MLPLLFAPQLPRVPGPLGPATPLPPAFPARVGPSETWRIRPVARPPRDSDEIKTRSLTVSVAGRRVVLRPKDGYDYVEGVERGRDGSLLVHRTNRHADPWEWRDTLWYRGKETVVWGAQAYLDRKDYASFFVREEGTAPFNVRETAPEATAVRDGKPVSLGWGWPKAWTPEGAIVLEVPVDDAGQPASQEFTSGTVTRILSGGREWRVQGYQYLGRMRDGTIALVSARPGIVDPSKKAAGDRVLTWKGGRFVAHVVLPARWRAVGLLPDGWLLARRRPEPRPLPPIPVENRRVESIVMDLERAARSDDDPDTRAERDWTVGMLKGGTFTPVVFPKPKGAERLLWRGGAASDGPRAFRFNAFWGDIDRAFRVAAP